ncbi:sulfurtransferase [Azospirillum sp.]|uniref:sulfurtransferase n=1 Tax=Azospirillum sp. TaxID=34012 RepID=UPI002D4CB1E0|nr:rhodanese-like domain-containing protein [Azospirillum sp.]HYD66204.1 rhodanese-like domain-containing protein [Azospirillum sp.]
MKKTLLSLSLAALLSAGLSVGDAAWRPALATEAATSAAAIVYERDWVVSPQAARELIAQGALVLDVRDPKLKSKQPLPNAVPLVWQDLSEPALPTKGRLIADDAVLTKKLQDLGVSKERPVVVVADPVNGWGEDGRIAWTLRTLGHSRAVLIDGGLPALVRDGAPAIAPAGGPGDFVVQRTDRFEVKRDDLKGLLGTPDLVVIDAREPREYEGKTPYGETRGGHVPGARHIWYKDLLDKDGKLLPRAEIEKRLAALGASKDTPIVAYCTGGIRSGWFTSVLNDLGYKARNYAGSMWEWSASPADAYPLTVKN